MNHVSAEVLQTLGFKMSRDVLYETDISSEKKLWRSVLMNAVEDTLIINSDRKSALIKLKAHNWILDPESNFSEVCCCADMDSDSIITSYKKALSDRIVRFTKKQLMWYDYDKLYRKIDQLPNEINKKAARKHLKILRESILKTPNYFVTTIFISKIV